MTPEDAAHTEKFLAKVRSPHAARELQRWAKRHEAVFYDAHWSGRGFTEAQVLGAHVQKDGEHVQGVIIKIVTKGDPDKEFTAHKKAYRDSPTFAECHLARIVEGLQLESGGSVTFQSVAGGGFRETQEIDEALPERLDQVDTCQHITSSLLTEWNTKSTSKPEQIGTLLAQLLKEPKDRLAPGGTLHLWAAEHEGLLTAPRRWISQGGQLWINPFALVGNGSLGDQLDSVLVTRGKVHGDLHPGNLLLPARDHTIPFFLVDLARHSDSRPLAWDPVYLLLTTIAKSLSVVDRRTLDTLQQWVIDPGHPQERSWPAPLRAIGVGTARAGEAWAHSRSSTASWRTQRLLCVVAVSLVLTGRDRLLQPGERAWFFWLAARAATQLVSFEPGPEEEPLILPATLIPQNTVIRLDDHRGRETTGSVRSVESPSVVGVVADEVGAGTQLASAPTATVPNSVAREAAPGDGPWDEFLSELHTVRLDAPDAAVLAACTETLRLRLERALSMLGDGTPGGGSGSGSEAAYLLGQLRATFEEAFQAGSTDTEVRAACRHAQLLRTWILGLSS
ncbi:hypothetical protein P1S61_39520 [Streptomyces sp. ME08-AFT2]|uniref:hypothetical protein n=1 Tax=Streptomyces sp. ME08-AFT2 TaxID=3028683 RepID=UPI0029A96F39|nr:hypothetical protein [Streptomyces sp. ME08-AFT2]MDX3315044.1 hypothetical protein [Streptomyces sp. ME08-AFT2]